MSGELFQVVIGLQVTFVGDAADSLGYKQQHIMQVVDQMGSLEDCNDAYSDSDLSVDLAAGVVEAHMAVYAGTLPDAVNAAYTWLRTAIHGAGGYTPGWGPPAERGPAPTYRGVSQEAHMVGA